MDKLGSRFTIPALLELFIVVSIIAFIVYSTVTILTKVTAKARDTRRVANLKQMATVLAVYFNAHGQYPQPARGWGKWSGHCSSFGDYDNYILDLVPTYTTTLPHDPLFDSGTQCYIYNSDGNDYMLVANYTLETIVGGDPSAAGNPAYFQNMDRLCCIQPSIAVYTVRARNW